MKLTHLLADAHLKGGTLIPEVPLIIAMCVVLSAPGHAAERQRDFTNADIERVLRENPGLASTPAAPRAGTIYLCKQAKGGSIWTDMPCHRSDSSTIDVFAVPAGLTFEERVAHAQGQRRQKAVPTVQRSIGPGTTLTLQQKHDECLKLKADLSALWRRHRDTETYLRLSEPLKARQDQIGCD